VAGEKSRNIVVISPDGNSAKEVYQISSPRGMSIFFIWNYILFTAIYL
jgi:phosphoribosylpyrophosphate synthetase